MSGPNQRLQRLIRELDSIYRTANEANLENGNIKITDLAIGIRQIANQLSEISFSINARDKMDKIRSGKSPEEQIAYITQHIFKTRGIRIINANITWQTPLLGSSRIMSINLEKEPDA